MTNNTVTKMKKCSHCKSEIPRNAPICPVCKKKPRKSFGRLFLDAVLILFLFFIGIPFTVVTCSKKLDNIHKTNNEGVSNTNTENASSSNYNNSEDNTKEIITEINNETEASIDIDNLSEEEYKSNCKQIYYEDIEDDRVSKNDYIKVEVYLEQILMKDLYDAMADSLWQENNLSLTYFSFGVLCRDYENNYGGENYLLFSNDIDLDAINYNSGSYFYLYGKVLKVETNGWTGKKSLYLMPKYIDNK